MWAECAWLTERGFAKSEIKEGQHTGTSYGAAETEKSFMCPSGLFSLSAAIQSELIRAFCINPVAKSRSNA